MRSFDILGKALGLCAAAALLAGCSQSQPWLGSPLGAPPSGASQRALDPTASWIAPEAKTGDLLYVSDAGNRRVDVFSYPRGKSVGRLYGFVSPAGECVDAAGNVFVVDTEALEIVEYAHGLKKPIATLDNPGYDTRSCSVDPTTGNLEVANECGTRYGSYCAPYEWGNIAIYRRAKGSPKYYTDPDMPKFGYAEGTYDDRGDIFATAGYVYGSSYCVCSFTELPKGRRKIDTISMGQYKTGGNLQWDGKHLAVAIAGGGYGSSKIIQFAIRHRQGTEVGSTTLSGVVELNQFWIDGGTVIVATYNAPYEEVQYFNYPAGGSPTKTISGFSYPYGVTVSRAPSR